MKRCKNCDGDLRPFGDEEYKCKFCGAVYSADELGGDAPKSYKAPRSKPGQSQANDIGARIWEMHKNAVLDISCRFRNSACSGSGYLIDMNGLAITNTHVVTDSSGRPCDNITVRIAGENVSASVIMLGDDKGGQGSGVDLALLQLKRVPKNATTAELCDFKTVRNGEAAFVIGNSLGDGSCITSGVVSDRLRVLDGAQLLMTDCAVNPGNSGGPIFNKNGLVIGTIVSMRLTREGIPADGMKYAVPSFIVEEFLNGEHCAVRLRPIK